MPARARYIVAVIGAVMVAACGGSATVSGDSATPTATPSDSVTAAAASGAAWSGTEKTKANIPDRQQLLCVSLPPEDVLAATGPEVALTPYADGTVRPGALLT